MPTALALAAGQVLRMPLQQVADAQQFGGLGHVDPALLRGDALETEFQVGPHRQMREQAGLLKHITQRAFMRRYEDPLCDCPARLRR